MSNYNLKAIKIGKGDDGIKFSAKLYLDKTKIADVIDLGYGGYLDVTFKTKNEQIVFDKYLLSLGKVELPDASKIDMTYDIFLFNLFDTTMENNELKKKCKKNTLVITNDCKKGEFYTYNFPYSIEAVDAIREHHGKKNIVEFINERFV